MTGDSPYVHPIYTFHEASETFTLTVILVLGVFWSVLNVGLGLIQLTTILIFFF